MHKLVTAGEPADPQAAAHDAVATELCELLERADRVLIETREIEL